MGRDWIDEGLRHEREREAQHQVESSQHAHETSVIKAQGPDLMHRIVEEIGAVVEEYRLKAQADSHDLEFEMLPSEGFWLAKTQLPKVALECRPDYDAHLLRCSLARTDDKDSEPTERLFNLNFVVDDSGNVRVRKEARVFQDLDEAVECLVKPVLFPLVD